MSETMTCPRCGSALMLGQTPEHKVCRNCTRCGGRLVTLPVLKDGLGAKGTAVLTRAAREAPKDGSRCPSCGNAMSLLKVEVEGHKVEIDVCDKCLSVWCDCGEFEMLVPPRTPKKAASLHDLAMRASPEARERLGKAMLDELPEDVEPSDITMGDIAFDLVRLIVGAPTLWRTVRPVTPIFAILLTLALPVAHACAYYAWHQVEYHGFFLRRYRAFWVLDEAMMNAGGFELGDASSSWLTAPFLQTDGSFAVILAFLIFPVFIVVERKAGHVKFLLLLALFWLTSVVFHVIQIAWELQKTAYLCGIGPIAIGFIAFLLKAYPNLRIRWSQGGDLATTYWYLAALVVLMNRLFACLRYESYSFALLALVGCGAVGAWMGRIVKARRSRESE